MVLLALFGMAVLSATVSAASAESVDQAVDVASSASIESALIATDALVVDEEDGVDRVEESADQELVRVEVLGATFDPAAAEVEARLLTLRSELYEAQLDHAEQQEAEAQAAAIAAAEAEAAAEAAAIAAAEAEAAAIAEAEAEAAARALAVASATPGQFAAIRSAELGVAGSEAEAQAAWDEGYAIGGGQNLSAFHNTILPCESGSQVNRDSVVGFTDDWGRAQINRPVWRTTFQDLTGLVFEEGVIQPVLNGYMAAYIEDVQGLTAWTCWRNR